MLVLSRHIGEGVKIGGNIEVVVQEIRGNRVKLSFKAPRDINIIRDELLSTPDKRIRNTIEMC